MTKNATSYIDELAGLLKTTSASDSKGRSLSLDQGVSQAVELILAVAETKGRVMVVGNGGSAAIASHMQNDLANAVGVRSLSFQETPTLTALANDHGYGCSYESQVSRWAEPGDLLVAISSSGRSENILRAVREAAARGCRVLTMTGFKPDNPLRAMGEINFHVPADSYGLVEVAHSALTHLLTDLAMAGQPPEEGR